MHPWKRMPVLCAALAVLSGCAIKSDLMAPAESQSVAVEPGKATVVFIRPSTYGGAIQSSVHDTTGGDTEFIGIVSARTSVAYQAEPGERYFMVASEAADFLKADLAAGRTYYVLVEPRMGLWKARFSLKPVRRAFIESGEFRQWREGTSFVRVTDAAHEWFRANKADLQSKQSAYFEKWQNKSDAAKAEVTLNREDGI